MYINLLEDVAQTASAMGGLLPILSLVFMFGAFWLFIMRPQKKKQKQEEKMRNDVQIGDEIVTIGGFNFRVISIKEDSLIVESLADHTKQKISKWAIQSNLTIHD